MASRVLRREACLFNDGFSHSSLKRCTLSTPTSTSFSPSYVLPTNLFRATPPLSPLASHFSFICSSISARALARRGQITSLHLHWGSIAQDRHLTALAVTHAAEYKEVDGEDDDDDDEDVYDRGPDDIKESSKGGFQVVNFYVLVDIDDPHLEVARHTAYIKGKNIHGRIYINYQGINAQYSGPQEDVLDYAEWVKSDPRFSSLYIQVSPSFYRHVFPRLRLRYKPSLIQVEGGTSILPITESSSRAVSLTPKQWKEKLSSALEQDHMDSCLSLVKESSFCQRTRTTLLLDLRNGYEWDVGHFKGAQRPEVDCFKSTGFGLDQSKESDPLADVDKEHTEVLMYCTGGIRCDVYSTMLREKGFKNLYTLKGGVARYLIEETGEYWVGNLFVFDARLSMPPFAYKLGSQCCDKGIDGIENNFHEYLDDNMDLGSCSLCHGPLSSHHHRNCANLDCNKLHLSCEPCASQLKGCCSLKCTSAERLRPYFDRPHNYKRWHNYRKKITHLCS